MVIRIEDENGNKTCIKSLAPNIAVVNTIEAKDPNPPTEVKKPNIEISKTSTVAGKDYVHVGESFDYIITAKNNGTEKGNAVITDSIPAEFTVDATNIKVDDQEADNSVVVSGNKVEWKLKDLAVNDSKVLKIRVTAKDITYGEDATVEAKIIPNTTAGNIKFSLDDNIVQTGVITNGSASVIFTNLEIGKHSVIASYDGINSTPVVFNVNKISAYDMTVNAPAVFYGNNVSAVITLPEDATGDVNINIGNETYNGKLINGKTTIDIPNLVAGNTNATVVYFGDKKYADKTVNTTFTVIGNTVTNATFFTYFDKDGVLNMDIPFADLIFAGNFSGLNLSTLTIDKKINLIGEKAFLNDIGLVIKADNISVSNFVIVLTNTSGVESAIDVRGANASINTNMISVDSAFDKDSFVINAENAANLTIDNNTIVYSGKTDGNGINNIIKVIDSDNVNILNNYIFAEIPSVPVKYMPPTWTATVKSAGIYTEGSANLNIASNNIAIEYNNASGADDTIHALYIGGGDNAVVENNNISIKGHTYVYGITIDGKNFTIASNAFYSDSDNNYADGIQIYDNSNGIIKDNEVFVESPVVAYGIYSSNWGSKANNIIYEGNNVAGNSTYIYGIYVSGNNETLTGNEITLVGNFTTGVASSAANVILNKNDIVTSGNNIGNASNCGDSIIAETTGIKIAYGNASVTNCTVKTTGENTVNTTGSGSVTYNYLVSNTGLGDKTVQSNNKTIVENNGPEFLLTVPELVKIYGSADKLTAILTDASHNPIANANITFTINGRNYTKTTNETGVASLNINLYPGVFTVSASYNDTTVNSTVIVTSSIIGDNIVKIFQNGTQFFATFYGKDGKPLANNTDVTFNINGVFYTRQTNENGTARLNINLIPGKYILTAINPANNEEKGFNVTVLSNVETANLVKYYKNESQFAVKVLNGDGTPANGTNVTFNINGVFYTRDVINGTATLNINLDPGKYIITTMYGKYSVGNNITVLPTLITEDLNMKFQDGSRFTAQALDGQGKPLANQTVFFNVNGVLYNRTTDADGFAKLLIRLNPGKYIITSIWNGYQVGRTITIS